MLHSEGITFHASFSRLFSLKFAPYKINIYKRLLLSEDTLWRCIWNKIIPLWAATNTVELVLFFFFSKQDLNLIFRVNCRCSSYADNESNSKPLDASDLLEGFLRQKIDSKESSIIPSLLSLSVHKMYNELLYSLILTWFCPWQRDVIAVEYVGYSHALFLDCAYRTKIYSPAKYSCW